DAWRCADFVAALRFYSGEAEPEGVNCERTAESRRLAFSAVVPLLGGSHGAPTGRFGLAPDAVPDDWRPGDPVHGCGRGGAGGGIRTHTDVLLRDAPRPL